MAVLGEEKRLGKQGRVLQMESQSALWGILQLVTDKAIQTLDECIGCPNDVAIFALPKGGFQLPIVLPEFSPGLQTCRVTALSKLLFNLRQCIGGVCVATQGSKLHPLGGLGQSLLHALFDQCFLRDPIPSTIDVIPSVFFCH